MFFKQLWDEHRVAVITYRKNVKDEWNTSLFKSHTLTIQGNETQMLLAEKEVILNDVSLREIRRLCANGHQTSIVTSNKKLTIDMVALYMFSRWSQENFFRYMRQDYDFDKMVQYAVEQVDEDVEVVNPEYNRLDYKLKKIREKITRRLAQLYKLEHENVKDSLDSTGKNQAKQVLLEKELEEMRCAETALIEQRKETSYRIKIKDMPEDSRYNRLHLESKHFQNIIKMICYRAETSLANLLSPYYKRAINEKRDLAKRIITSKIDLLPDYENGKLSVVLYSLATPKDNAATIEICELLNKQKTKYPGTDLILNYSLAT